MTDPLRLRFPWLDPGQEPWLRAALLRRAAEGFEHGGHWQEAADCWVDLGEPLRAGELYARAGDRRQGARTLLAAGRYPEALAAYRAWAELLTPADRQGRIEALLGQAACHRLGPGTAAQAETAEREARALIAEVAAPTGPGPYAVGRAWSALGDYGTRLWRTDLIQFGYEQALDAFAGTAARAERLAVARDYLRAVQIQGDRGLAVRIETLIGEWTPEGDEGPEEPPPPTYEELVERARGIRAGRRLEGHSDRITSVAFSPDGRWVATGSCDRTIRVWAVDMGEPVRTLEGHSAQVMGLAFSPNGQVLASCAWQDSIRLWALDTGRVRRALEGHGERVNAIAFSPDGQVLASASGDGTVRLWTVRSGETLRALAGHKDRVTGIAFSMDGTRLGSGSHDHSIRIWNLASGVQLSVLQGHTSWVNGIAFDPAAEVLASCSSDTTVRLWDVATGRETLSLDDHKTYVTAVAWTPDGSVLISRGAGVNSDGEVRFWHASTGQTFHTLPQRKEQQDTKWITRALAISPDGRLLATYPEDTVNAIQLWDISALGVGPRRPGAGSPR